MTKIEFLEKILLKAKTAVTDFNSAIITKSLNLKTLTFTSFPVLGLFPKNTIHHAENTEFLSPMNFSFTITTRMEGDPHGTYALLALLVLEKKLFDEFKEVFILDGEQIKVQWAEDPEPTAFVYENNIHYDAEYSLTAEFIVD